MGGQSMEMTFEDTFQPAYKGKLFVVNPAKRRESFNIDVDPMTPEGKGMVEKVKKLWTARMKALRSAKEKEYGAASNDTARIQIGRAQGGREGKMEHSVCRRLLVNNLFFLS